jgi:septal ring factor EnvC (AmiA/AmiB activator)
MADVELSDLKAAVRDLTERSKGYRESLRATKKAFADLRDAIAAQNTKYAEQIAWLAAYAGNDKALVALKAECALVQTELATTDSKAAAAQTWNVANP